MEKVKVVPKKVRYLAYKYLIEIYENGVTERIRTCDSGLCFNLSFYLVKIKYFDAVDAYHNLTKLFHSIL